MADCCWKRKLWFENEKVKGRKFERLNDDIYTYIIPNEEWYFVSPTEIKWGYLSLNRKSLILTENNSPYFKDTVSKCILFVNKDNFEKYWENLELKLQSEYDEMTKDNKI